MNLWRVLTIVSFSVLLGGCPSLTKVGETIQKASPPASLVIESSSVPHSRTPVYTREVGFNFTVKRGLFNTLSLKRNGRSVQSVDRADVSKIQQLTNAREDYFYAVDMETNTETMVWRQDVNVRLGSVVEGKEDIFEFTETSINPEYKNTDKEKATITFKLTYVSQKPTIVHLTGPASVHNGQTASISWKVLHAKKVELFQAGSKKKTQVADGAMGTIEGTYSGPQRTLNNTHYYTTFKIKAYNVYDEMVDKQINVNITPAPVCPAGKTLGVHRFCLVCTGSITGDYRTEYDVPACSKDDAKAWVQSQGVKCQVRDGGC